MWQEVRFSTMTVLLTTQSERQCLDQAAMTRRLKEREGEKEKARTKQRERERRPVVHGKACSHAVVLGT